MNLEVESLFRKDIIIQLIMVILAIPWRLNHKWIDSFLGVSFYIHRGSKIFINLESLTKLCHGMHVKHFHGSENHILLLQYHRSYLQQCNAHSFYVVQVHCKYPYTDQMEFRSRFWCQTNSHLWHILAMEWKMRI